MKIVLFCQNAYAFGIMQPLRDVLNEGGHTYLWFITPKLKDIFPFVKDPVTQSIKELEAFKSDAIICPGNEVPYYLKGLKVQIFHGLAGEKKGHFRIRQYFDLYLTQGPYFTEGFQKLKAKYKNFEVIETGWPKLDKYQLLKDKALKEKTAVLKKHSATYLLLYAPTFSPSLTSAPALKKEIEKLAKDPKYVIHIKFHDLMDASHIQFYKALAHKYDRIHFIQEKDITKQLLIADILISDTSSVIYEFLLLDKPVITLNNISKNIQWQDIKNASLLEETVATTILNDPFKEQRTSVIAAYHPYSDGKSSARVVTAIKEYISVHGVPEKRKISWLRRRKINKLFDRNS